jgi:broad specificity phosphatase PhoE
MTSITFVRHGETIANVEHVWQGQGDAPLTELGRRQALDLGERLAEQSFDVVIASDLGRVLETAELAGLQPVVDPAWREVDIGRWEGLTREEVIDRFRDELEALGRGGDVSLGGGETWREFGLRIDAALRRLGSGDGGGPHILVLTHGGAIHSIVAGILGFRDRGRPWPIDRVENAALTVLENSDGDHRILSFNDSSHTTTTPHPQIVGPVVSLIRHAQTQANLDGRYQGTGEDLLTEEGERQAAHLASWLNGVTHIACSPRQRARATAGVLGAARGIEPDVREDLVEMDFGRWEDLTPAQISLQYPDEWRAVMVEGRDLPRGTEGETLAGAGARLGRVVEEAGRLGDHPALITHGAIIRGYAIRVLGTEFGRRHRLVLPRNASVTSVRLGETGPALSGYGVIGY